MEKRVTHKENRAFAPHLNCRPKISCAHAVKFECGECNETNRINEW